MYSMLNTEMIQARQADRTRDALRATHRRELREVHGPAPRRGRQLKRLAAVTAVLVLIGGASDALAATSTHFNSSRRCSSSQASHSMGTSSNSVNGRRFHARW